MESPLRVLVPQPEISGKVWAVGLASKVRSWLLLLASVGLRLLSGEEWRSQCLMGPSEGGASLYIGLLDTWPT